MLLMGWSQNMDGHEKEHYRFQSGSCMEMISYKTRSGIGELPDV
jgi:hypothetical protein